MWGSSPTKQNGPVVLAGHKLLASRATGVFAATALLSTFKLKNKAMEFDENTQLVSLLSVRFL